MESANLNATELDANVPSDPPSTQLSAADT
ncbi:hypothetical protein SAMN05192554_1262 [Haloarchaeobius iranensis]|uniref:Uncharacterized protein n=1 Tax=Haloarchaeobius iranensis TaxID=996166 RepID=A0A1H0AC92_9EURY|nr:hypothetical protein SAMN05192554_1262 [Haloarchaeobius iranensis]